MDFPINATMLDSIFVLFTILFLIRGYHKGFVVRLYSLLSIILSFWLSGLWVASQTGDISWLGFLQHVGMYWIAFGVIRIGFYIIGIWIKPMLKGAIRWIPIVSMLDRILGLCISMVELVCIIYIALLFCTSSVFRNGKEVIADSTITKYVLETSPFSYLKKNIQNPEKVNIQSFFTSQEIIHRKYVRK